MIKTLVRALTSGLVALGLIVGPAMASADIDAATNAYRASQGLAPLTTRQDLENLAYLRAQQIAVTFAHPTSWQWMFDTIPGCESALGENIAYYTSGYEPAGWPVSAWINSPTHRANMLRGWTWQGSATFRANGNTYAVQLFAGACDNPTPPQPPILNEIPDTHM